MSDEEKLDLTPIDFQPIIDMQYEVWKDLTMEQKVAAASVVLKAVSDHFEEGGTYRYLIYDRIGLDMGGYLPCYLMGGLNISNAIFLYREHKDELTNDLSN